MANEAYLVKQDTSFGKPVRTATTLEGVEIQETMGVAYGAGDYVLREELTERDQERADNGELDHLLEPADRKEAEAARLSVESGLFVPEHEAERYALLEAGHRVVEKDQLLELKSAGADAAREFLEESRKGPHDANPAITEAPSFIETPDLAAVSRGDADPGDVEHDNEPIAPSEVETEVSSSAAGVEQPPGLPIGPVLAKAEGADPEKVDKDAAKKPARRSRPGSGSSAKKDSESK